MARLNKPRAVSRADTKNFENHPAYTLGAKDRLYERVVCSLLGEKKYYQKGEDHNSDIAADVSAIAKEDPEYVLRIAAFARRRMHLRSTPIFLLIQAARTIECKPFVRKWAPVIISRADEPAEVIGGHLALFGKPFPKSLLRGVGDSLSHFDEYQMEKYSSRKGEVSLGDAINLTHPKPADANRSALYKYLVAGWDALTEEEKDLLPKVKAKKALVQRASLDDEAKRLMAEAHATWEVAISQFGNKAEVWDGLHIPFMAALRNLRNIISSGANVQRVLETLKRKENIIASKQLPFRFLSAYKEMEECANRGGVFEKGKSITWDFRQRQLAQEALAVLSVALDLSVENIEKLPGRTAIFADTSGSMQRPISAKSKVDQKTIACVLAALAGSICDSGSISAAFATDVAPVIFSPLEPTMTRVQKLFGADTHGWGTNGYRIFEWLLDPSGVRYKSCDDYYGYWKPAKAPAKPPKTFSAGAAPLEVDRVIVLSDMQMYGGGNSYGYGGSTSFEGRFNEYRQKVNPKCWLHSINLAGYGTSQVNLDRNHNVSMVAGWSDRLLEFVSKAEAGSSAVKEIEKLEPSDLT